jgi:thymidylate synthase ThyX
MSSGDELDDNNSIVLYDREGRTANYYSNRSAAKKVWERAAHDAISNALSLQKLGTHKSIVNRILEPFLHVNVLVTGTEPGWMNFFGLRLDKAAQPEIRVLAEAQRKCWNESVPNVLKPNEWHLPFIDWKEMTPFLGSNGQPLSLWEYQEDPQGEPLVIKISVARCARLSYNSFETSKRSTIEEDLALYNRLIGSSPIHASPAEHQATPDSIRDRGILGNQLRIIDNTLFPVPEWDQPKLHGNLSGWRQYRKMLAGEAIAPLPEAYR